MYYNFLIHSSAEDTGHSVWRPRSWSSGENLLSTGDISKFRPLRFGWIELSEEVTKRERPNVTTQCPPPLRTKWKIPQLFKEGCLLHTPLHSKYLPL